MTKVYTTLLLLLSAMTAATAQQPEENDNIDASRGKWIAEVRNYKNEYIARELDLSRQQQNEFFPLYDKMDEEITQLGIETRQLEQQTLSNPKATDVELEAAAKAAFNLKSEESRIEAEYFPKFKEILTPRQLAGLKNAERKFTRQVMRHHRRMRNNDDRR